MTQRTGEAQVNTEDFLSDDHRRECATMASTCHRKLPFVAPELLLEKITGYIEAAFFRGRKSALRTEPAQIRGVETGVAQSRRVGGGDVTANARGDQPKGLVEQRDFSPSVDGSSPSPSLDSTTPRRESPQTDRTVEWVRIKSELLDFLLEAISARDAATKRIVALESEILEARNEAATVRRAYLHERWRADAACVALGNHDRASADSLMTQSYRGIADSGSGGAP